MTNIFKDCKLDINRTCAENAHVQIKGNQKYNLSIITIVHYFDIFIEIVFLFTKMIFNCH